MALLTEAHCRPVPEPDEALSTPAKKKSRTLEARESLLAGKTKQVLWVLENRLAPTRSNETLRSGIELLKSLGAQTDELQDAMDVLVGRTAQGLHILLLDGALDRWVCEMIFQKRGEGSFAGFGFASDESPPSQPRFRGLRFQVTVMYIGTFAPLGQWESMADPPLKTPPCLETSATALGRKVSMLLELWRSSLIEWVSTAMMLAVAVGMEAERMKEAKDSMYYLRTSALAM